MTTKYENGFNNQNMKDFRKELENLVSEFNYLKGRDLGISLDLGNASYGGAECSFKLNATIIGQLTREQEAVEMFTDFKYGDMIRDLRSKKIFKLVGYKSRSPKKPVIIADLGGTEYKATDSFLSNVEHLVEVKEEK
jgi:hypothetical protein